MLQRGKTGMKRRSENLQNGFSFIELSIATAIFSIGLGSFSMVMLAAVQGTAEARHQTVAISHAESMAEMIAMTSDAFGHYVFPAENSQAPCSEGLCQSAVNAGENLLVWQNHLREELPAGGGLVCRDSTPDDGTVEDPSCDGLGPVVIKIFWEESRHKQTGDGGQRRVVSRLPW